MLQGVIKAALFSACEKGHVDVAAVLLDRGAAVNQARVGCMSGEGACCVCIQCGC